MMKQNHFEVLLEHMNSRFDLVLEAIQPLLELPAQVRNIEASLEELRREVHVIGFVQREHTKAIAELNRRTAHLA